MPGRKLYTAGKRFVPLAAAVVATALATSATATAPDPCKLLAAPRANDLFRIPFTTVSGRIYVEARVNGKGPYRFAIDTGASGMGRADTSLTNALSLPVSRTGESSDGVNSAAVDVARFESLELGGFVRTRLDVITRDYSSKASPEAAFSGIIGREFFGDGLLIIDYPSRTIRFSRSLRLARGGEGVLGYERAFRVPVSIGAVQTEGNLDTGANITFVLPMALFDRVSGGALQKASEGTLTNTRIETSRATVEGPFRIGNAEIARAEVRVSAQYPELLVGAHFLQDYAILIDQRSKGVALCQGAKAAQAPAAAKNIK